MGAPLSEVSSVLLYRWREESVSTLNMSQGTKNMYHIHVFICQENTLERKFTCFRDSVICNYFVLVFCF